MAVQVIAVRLLPDLIVLDLLMPEVNGFEVVDALNKRADPARIPIPVVTERIAEAERARLNGCVTTIMKKGEFDCDRFTAEVRRAVSGRHSVA